MKKVKLFGTMSRHVVPVLCIFCVVGLTIVTLLSSINSRIENERSADIINAEVRDFRDFIEGQVGSMSGLDLGPPVAVGRLMDGRDGPIDGMVATTIVRATSLGPGNGVYANLLELLRHGKTINGGSVSIDVLLIKEVEGRNLMSVCGTPEKDLNGDSAYFKDLVNVGDTVIVIWTKTKSQRWPLPLSNEIGALRP